MVGRMMRRWMTFPHQNMPRQDLPRKESTPHPSVLYRPTLPVHLNAQSQAHLHPIHLPLRPLHRPPRLTKSISPLDKRKKRREGSMKTRLRECTPVRVRQCQIHLQRNKLLTQAPFTFQPPLRPLPLLPLHRLRQHQLLLKVKYQV